MEQSTPLTEDILPSTRYEMPGRIRYSEVDHTGALTLPGLIDYFQDCSAFQSEDLGLGTAWLRNEHAAWVLSSWHILIDRLPRLGERVVAGTFATGFKRMFGNRCFYLEDAEGRLAARASSTWVYIDLARNRPTSPAPEHVAAYGTAPALPMPDAPRKIALPDELRPCKPLAVQPHHIDTNEHVNNGQYVQIALEALPEAQQVASLRVSYQRAAVLGDIICPSFAVEEDRSVVLLASEDGEPFATVEFK